MQVIEDAWDYQSYPVPTMATVGNFDGLHLGQRKILERLRGRAQAAGTQSAVVTFEPHPLTVLRPDKPLQRITTREQKHELIRRLGVDLLAIVRFTPQFARTSARQFVEEFLHGRLGIAELYVGSRFSFGHQRGGNLGLLLQLGKELGFRVEGVEEAVHDGETISSTRIRRAIRAGEVSQACDMLGRPFAVTGRVVHGDGRGKDHGWPTINVEPEHDLLPAEGVYTAQVWIPGRGRMLGAVANLGRRPTFPDGGQRVLEAHLFDFGRQVYGERVELGFVSRLRGERRFRSATELSQQISRDAELAREYLARPDCSRIVPTLTSRKGRRC